MQTVGWELRSHRAYQLPPFHLLTTLSERGYGLERDHVAKDEPIIGLTSA